MKNTTIFFLIVIVILLVGGFVFKGGHSEVTSKAILNNDQDPIKDSQRVVLSQGGYNYHDVIAEAGKPISISADDSVGGCLRSVVFNIEGKKYAQYLRTPAEILYLPALDKGTYPFSCTMGMGFGKLVVK